MTQSPVTGRTSPVRCAALCAIAIAAYANSFRAGFALDSRQLVLQDPRVHAATAANVSDILQHSYWWPYGESGLYRPATTLSYLLNYAVLGGAERPWPYHAFNLLAHALNVLLVFVLARRLTHDENAALASAALWAVLPTSVEAVTNIAGRADLLAALGVLAGLAAYRRSWIALGAAATLAVFSKESGIVILPMVIAYEVAFRDRKRSRRSLAAGIAAAGVPALVMWAARSAVLGAAPPAEFAFVDNPIVGASWIVGRLTALKTAGLYLWKLAWPATLSADYSFDAIPLVRGAVQDWLAWLTLIAAAAAAVFAARRSRAAAFCGAFVVLAFLPASNLVFASGTIFGERLLYLPSVGVATLAALALARLPRAAAIAVTSAIVVAFAGRTWQRNPAWTSDLTLWRAAVAAEPSSAKAHRALAEALYDADPTHANLPAVIDEAERSVAILDTLPDEDSSFQAYRQAAAYHLDEAHARDRAGADDPQRQADEAARRDYTRAATLAERGLGIVAAQAAKFPGASREPEADADRLLAAARLGLRESRKALDAAVRARAAGPLNPLAYRLSASARLLAQDADGAVVDLMTGSIVSGDSGLNDAAIALYRSGVDEQHCAVVTDGGRPALNLECPIVVRHTCAAIAEAIPIEQQLGRTDAAQRLTLTARTTLRCPPPGATGESR